MSMVHITTFECLDGVDEPWMYRIPVTAHFLNLVFIMNLAK